MTKPLGYYVSAPSITTDTVILAEIEDRYGSQLERLTLVQQSAWLISLIAEAIKPEGIEVNYCVDDIPDAEHLSNLSYEAKLSLCNVIINQLLYNKGKK